MNQVILKVENAYTSFKETEKFIVYMDNLPVATIPAKNETEAIQKIIHHMGKMDNTSVMRG